MCHVRFDLISRILPCNFVCDVRAAIRCYHFGWLGIHYYPWIYWIPLRRAEIRGNLSCFRQHTSEWKQFNRYLCYLQSVKAVIYASNLVHGLNGEKVKIAGGRKGRRETFSNGRVHVYGIRPYASSSLSRIHL